jgi:hypothetical protein
MKLPQPDMLAEDIFGHQKEWYEQKSVLAINEHIKQTLLIKLVPYLTDEQRDKMVEILKEIPCS